MIFSFLFSSLLVSFLDLYNIVSHVAVSRNFSV